MVANAIIPVLNLNDEEKGKINEVKSLSNIVYGLRYDVFKEGLDFGKIPGTGDRPTLLLPGMEKLMRALRLRAEYHAVSITEDYSGGVFAYRYECRLIEYDTNLCVSTAIGSCNSKESKYRWREQKRTCPNCSKETINRSKFAPKNNPSAQPGWYCYAKAGGCGTEFPHDDTTITSQPLGRIENPDIYDQVNTIDKIAQKRALSSAIKSAANVSELFTVDLEDFATYRFDADVVEGEIVETVVQPTLQQPAPEKPVSNGSGTHTLDWTIIYTELKPLFAGNTDNVRKAIEVLRETDYIKPDADTATIISTVKESLQNRVETPSDDVDLDTHFATPASVEDKPVVTTSYDGFLDDIAQITGFMHNTLSHARNNVKRLWREKKLNADMLVGEAAVHVFLDRCFNKDLALTTDICKVIGINEISNLDELHDYFKHDMEVRMVDAWTAVVKWDNDLKAKANKGMSDSNPLKATIEAGETK